MKEKTVARNWSIEKVARVRGMKNGEEKEIVRKFRAFDVHRFARVARWRTASRFSYETQVHGITKREDVISRLDVGELMPRALRRDTVRFSPATIVVTLL